VALFHGKIDDPAYIIDSGRSGIQMFIHPDGGNHQMGLGI
jgi:hypothetical protein